MFASMKTFRCNARSGAWRFVANLCAMIYMLSYVNITLLKVISNSVAAYTLITKLLQWWLIELIKYLDAIDVFVLASSFSLVRSLSKSLLSLLDGRVPSDVAAEAALVIISIPNLTLKVQESGLFSINAISHCSIIFNLYANPIVITLELCFSELT